MTRYTVVWDKDFEADLINTWADSDSETRAVLTAVADWADDHLGLIRTSKANPSRSPACDRSLSLIHKCASP